jgi:CheY-like chemotaxis protein
MGRLDERVILIAEDEPLLGLDIADSLRGEGANVISAHNVKDALTRAATEDLSAAVLDINLAGRGLHLICQQLTDRTIPFMFHTGYTDMPVLEKWANVPTLRKPSSPEDIIKALVSLFG